LAGIEMPHWLTGFGVDTDESSGVISKAHQTARGGQNAAPASALAHLGTSQAIFSGFQIDRFQV
jgi:hypothetical protein